MNFSLTETLKSIELPNNQYSSLAQSVEHLTVNQGVVGSSPTGGAKKKGTANGRALLFDSFS